MFSREFVKRVHNSKINGHYSTSDYFVIPLKAYFPELFKIANWGQYQENDLRNKYKSNYYVISNICAWSAIFKVCYFFGHQSIEW